MKKARAPHSAVGAPHIRIAAATLLAVVVTYVGGLWLHLLREAQVATDAGTELGIAHWLREATLALPVVVLATWAGLRLVRRLARPVGDSRLHLLEILTTAAIVATAASVVEGLLSPVSASLFGGHAGHVHATGAPVLDMARDGFAVLPANLLLATIVLALLRGRIWRRPAADAPRLPEFTALLLRRAILLGASGGLAAAVALAAPGESAQISAASPASPCPTSAPVKSFDVSAIDVKMWLNRWGDSDPQAQMFVLDSMIDAVRAQEAAGPSSLSIGLRDDPLQTLVLRVNEGDCVAINFTNRTTRPAPGATSNVYGLHIEGLAYDTAGDGIGNNGLNTDQQRTYTFYVPNDTNLEGAHLIQSGPGNRQAVAHGLFGVLAVEPPGSSYLNMTTGAPQRSGWEAIIVPGSGKSFRENVQAFHEIGNESERELNDGTPVDLNGVPLKTIDPHTGAYRPGSRAINYRSEPFMDRLNEAPDEESQSYGSYMFADTSNVIMRGYLADPTKIRLVHAGSEVFHVFHLHGGADRWRFDPKADPTFSYSKTGLDKNPIVVQSESERLDSQTIGPGESYSLEIENGAGGAQQGAGEFLFHCHIGHHYLAGMWGVWRVFDTLQPDLMPLPDRTALPKAVTSADLVGQKINGQKISSSNLDAWIRPQLPAQGVTKAINPATGDDADEDASVWDWTVDSKTRTYLGEPDRAYTVKEGPLAGQPYPDFANVVPGHPAALVVDQQVQSTYLLNGQKVSFTAGGYVGSRPKILFNPTNGRPAWPLLRPHITKRPPFAPNNHSGAPYLGETGGKAPAKGVSIDPFANRSDGICPSSAPLKTYNVVAIAKPITVTDPGKAAKVVDPLGALDVLAEDKDAIYAGTKVYAGDPHAEPLALRANIGDCVALTYTSELKDGGPEVPFSKTNIHIHHVQFDTQGSDGVITGFSYEQSVRPYKIVDPQLSAAAKAGDTVITMTSVAKFQPGVSIGVGLGTNGIELRQIKSISTSKKQLTLDRALTKAHAADEWAGTEFVQYRWFPDVALDNIFFHDHVNSLHGWSHGMVGQLLIEPSGSRYFDPVTGDEIRAGSRADIHTDPTCTPGTAPAGYPANTSNQCVLLPGTVDGSFREFALWPITSKEPAPPEATLNLRAEPWSDRTCLDPSQRFSASCGGDPFTPIMKAYAGDPVVIRDLDVGQGTKTLSLDGHRTFLEDRYRDANGIESSPVDTIHTGVSERFSLVLDGGAGGPNHVAGDFLYHTGDNRRFVDGAWGIIRVLGNLENSLKPLPGFGTPAAEQPTCPTNAPVHTFAVTALDLPSTAAGGGKEGRRAAFVPTSTAAAVLAKATFPEPLVLHVAAKECIQVTLTNARTLERASFHVGGLLKDLGSTGINIGNNPGDQTVAPGGTRTYTFYADTQKLETVAISDFGGTNGPVDGLYGAIVVAPAGSFFTDPFSGNRLDAGSKVDVHVPGQPTYRDFTLILADHDGRIGQDTMPYPKDVDGPALVNYRQVAPRTDDQNMFNSAVYGDPATPLLRAYAGDPVKVHVLNAPGSEQLHVFSLGGMRWAQDMYVHGSNDLESRAIGPWEKQDLLVKGGAGGVSHTPGDYFYGDLRRPFTQAGMWGLFRVLPDTCSSGGTFGLRCLDAPLPAAALAVPSSGATALSSPGASSAGTTEASGAPSLLGPRRTASAASRA